MKKAISLLLLIVAFAGTTFASGHVISSVKKSEIVLSNVVSSVPKKTSYNLAGISSRIIKFPIQLNWINLKKCIKSKGKYLYP